MSASLASDQYVQGSFLDGRSSLPKAASIRRLGAVLLLEVDGIQRRLELQQIRHGMQVGSGRYYLHLPDGAVFECADQPGLGDVLQGLPGYHGAGLLRRLESNLRLILFSVVLLVGLLLGGVFWGVPWASRMIAHALPVEVETYLGRETLSALDRFWLKPSQLDPQREQAIRAYFAEHLELLSASYPGHGIELLFRSGESGIGANALALPAGVVIFTDELVALAGHDDELLAILAHEVGHVVHRHNLRGIIQTSLVAWLMISVTGDLSAASEIAAALPLALSQLGYSRDMEREADDFALQYLLQQGISPVHFSNIMRRLDPPDTDQEAGRGLKMLLSTHPSTGERIRRFEQAEEQARP
ncbi:MAG: M48 family metallopeptidase [Halopseudomonas yangmingensis]|uniref:Peptidase family M48 n=1 Tax=Halopseudomonas yangmingensis TaxID=1720063 RepID=A0A1I4PVF4_9GAMM|nr:M48 family metallopeptidase [Halopseudomonas yangmingensis]SFM31799.1 Peptidase family M48 [Halopseudomonas yangmingensis]